MARRDPGMDYLRALAALLGEWDSPEDDEAFADLALPEAPPVPPSADAAGSSDAGDPGSELANDPGS